MAVLALLAASFAGGQRQAVTGVVKMVRLDGKKTDSAGVVIWLEPLNGAKTAARPLMARMNQKNKRFDPHVLVVPVGSTVAFPNLDPFFHNVFSLFDGRRFDLGLYEAGASRSVTFPRSGVCYIFCNIHPEMSAIVVVVDSPYYTATAAGGGFSIDAVPPGRYKFHLWHQSGKPAVALPVEIEVGSGGLALPPIRLDDSGPLVIPHKNKQGRDYDPAPGGVIYK